VLFSAEWKAISCSFFSQYFLLVGQNYWQHFSAGNGKGCRQQFSAMEV
jgi:hypothetical protein